MIDVISFRWIRMAWVIHMLKLSWFQTLTRWRRKRKLLKQHSIQYGTRHLFCKSFTLIFVFIVIDFQGGVLYCVHKIYGWHEKKNFLFLFFALFFSLFFLQRFEAGRQRSTYFDRGTTLSAWISIKETFLYFNLIIPMLLSV
jgi:hypothetical protein